MIVGGDEALIDRRVERGQVDLVIRRGATHPEPQDQDGQHWPTESSTVRDDGTGGYPIVALVDIASKPYLSSSFWMRGLIMEVDLVIPPLVRALLLPFVAEFIEVAGGIVSTDHVNDDGAPPVFPTLSSALRCKMWAPSFRLLN